MSRFPRLSRPVAVVAALCLLLSAMLSLTGCGGASEKIVVLNYGQYMDTEVLDLFEQETGIRVVYEEFDTNEEMYAKVSAGTTKYDLVCCSDYMVEKMIAGGELTALDASAMPCLANVNQLGWDMTESYDPGHRYSVPFFWGTLGILYNTSMVEEPTGWDVLFDEANAGNIIMTNSVRDAFGVALKYKGYSINTEDTAQLEEAKALLAAQKPLVRSYLIDSARDEMAAGNAAYAVVYSSEAYIAMDANEDLDYVVPMQGSNIWVDAWVMPSAGANHEGAQKFLDFLCREDVARINFDYVYCASPIEPMIDALDEELRNDTAMFPPDEVVAQCEMLRSLSPETEAYFNEAWKEIKA